jgi:hypothetical protein
MRLDLDPILRRLLERDRLATLLDRNNCYGAAMTKRDSAAHGPSHAAGFLAFTIDPRTARIVKLEAFDARGARHELSQEERTSLIKRRGERKRTIEQVVERAQLRMTIECLHAR